MVKNRKRAYAGVLDIPEGEQNGIRIRHKHQPPGTTLQSGNFRTALFGQKSESVTFKAATIWHELSEKGQGVWMTDLPIEQRQMDELITKARGRVLVGGLGLGYAVVALSAMRSVEEIVVVERNPDIVALVWAATVAKCRKGVPVSVVTEDLFDYLLWATAKQERFDWGLFDIWQGDGETTFHQTVVPLRAAAARVVRELECWNEDVMRGQLMMGLRTRLMFLGAAETASVVGSDLTKGMPTLEFLCEPHQSIYTDWSVAFWRWYRENAGAANIDVMLALYASSYGRPERAATLARFEARHELQAR